MSHKTIPLSSIEIPPRAYTYIRDICTTNRLTYGPYTKKFEKAFSAIHHNQYGVFVNSGTSALTIAIAALKIHKGWRDGDEILVPALTFVSDVNVILHNALTPVFVDVSPTYFDMDPKNIEKALTPKTKAILVPHLFGQPAPIDEITIIAKKHRLVVIEDACEAPFATYKRKPVGSWGDITCFSTNAAHILTTGNGGMATTNNSMLADIMRSLASHGRDTAYISIDDDDDATMIEHIIRKRFLFPYVGFNMHATELEAAIGLAQLRSHKPLLKKRMKNAAYLTKKLTPLTKKITLPRIRPGATDVFMMYPIIITSPTISRDTVCLYLEKHGIETRYLLPLITQPAYKKLHIRQRDFPVATRLASCGFYVGCHPGLTTRDLDFLVKHITACIV